MQPVSSCIAQFSHGGRNVFYLATQQAEPIELVVVDDFHVLWLAGSPAEAEAVLVNMKGVNY